MAYKIFVLAAIVASATAGYVPASPAVSYAFQSAPVAAHAPVAYAAAPVYQKYAVPEAPVVHATPFAHVVHAAPVAHYAPIAKAVVAEPYAPPHYDFGYSVSDPHTGDSKTQQESRVDDAVHGSYSLIDSDGFKRTVEYTADDHNGFNAVVHREPLGKVIAPVAYAAPALAVATPAVKLLH